MFRSITNYFWGSTEEINETTNESKVETVEVGENVTNDPIEECDCSDEECDYSDDDDDDIDMDIDNTYCLSCNKEFVNPVTLECGHIYCLTCIKGDLYNNGYNCPTCRKPVSSTYISLVFQHPEKICEEVKESNIDLEEIIWLYSTKHNSGIWWYFDSRNNLVIEQLYQDYLNDGIDNYGNSAYICGFDFKFDFEQMIEKSVNSEERRIKRISTYREMEEFKRNNYIKGACGIRFTN